MKRKRGHKKGKPKGTTTTPVVSASEAHRNSGAQNKEEASGLDDFGNDDRDNSGMEADTPSSTGTDQHYNLANINPDGSIDKGAAKSVGRVKVKLKTPKMLDSQPTSSDVPTQSDTDKSSQLQGLEKQGVSTERMEDSANSLPDATLGAPSKRAGSIKIKSSKVLGSNADQTHKPFSDSAEITHPKERKGPQLNTRYNKQELDAALVVIRKVMKMDAAEPFNAPVNPDALGIPDYFDIIDTPMDFGTICSDLEKNDKYMNSEDVFKDVQYIWDNCYKYNNKGDYVLDLMRRVKKNFMKYWTAAGLYSEQPKGTKGVDKNTAEEVVLSGEGKAGKGSQLKKTKKRHGRHHKHDCLCAICVLKRRRKEREENARMARSNFGSADKLAKEFKQQESMLVESPGGEDSSSDMDDSMGTDGDAEEDKAETVKMEINEKQHSPSEGQHEDNDVEDDDRDDNDHGQEEGESEEDGEEDEEEIEMDSQNRQTDESLKESQLAAVLGEKSNVGDATAVLQEDYATQQEGQAAVVQQHTHKESQDKNQKAKLLESLCLENPQLSRLCGILFPKNNRSVWSGPHSLMQHRKSPRTSSIHAAIRAFME